MTSIKKNKVASATWQKEIKRCIALSALDVVYGKNTMRKTAMEKEMYKLYHGTGEENNVSFLTLSLNGEGQFDYLWELNDNGDNQVKVAWTRCEKKLVAYEAFTEESLSVSTQKSSKKLSGRNLLIYANSSLLNFKKAYGHALKFLHPGPGFEYPSGTNESDLDNFVLDRMYLELVKSPNVVIHEDLEADDDNVEETEPQHK